VNNYPQSGATPDHSYFTWITGSPYNYALPSGKIQIIDGLTPEGQAALVANYTIDTANDFDVRIDFGSNSYTVLTMDGSVGRSNPRVVTAGDTTTTTTTTIIRWSLPEIQKKGGA